MNVVNIDTVIIIINNKKYINPLNEIFYLNNLEYYSNMFYVKNIDFNKFCTMNIDDFIRMDINIFDASILQKLVFTSCHVLNNPHLFYRYVNHN